MAESPRKAALENSTAPGELELRIIYRNVDELKPNPQNPRKHSHRQLRFLRKVIRKYGFLMPAIVDAEGNIICGHARCEAAKKAGISRVPTILISHLSDAEIKALMVADNRLSELGEFDEIKLGELFIELSTSELEFDPEFLGFSTGEVASFIDNLPAISNDAPDPADSLPQNDRGPTVSKLGNLWLLGERHRVLCGNALENADFAVLMEEHKAGVVFTDHPYNLKASTISGLGKVKHQDFVMAAGEMSDDEYLEFLTTTNKHIARYSKNGAIAFLCIDYRHLAPMLEAGRIAFRELKNLCVWVKNPGMGSLYRSSHELVLVFKNGTARHINNVELGKNHRHRTNVWSYPSINNFGRAGEEGNLLHLHPTLKPVRMIADAILDCSNRGDIVLDCFLGGGSTVIAAERTNRRCFGLELDPRYVDTIIRRWQAYTRESAVLSGTERTFDDIAAEVADVRECAT
jgi:DNA modification methylase